MRKAARRQARMLAPGSTYDNRLEHPDGTVRATYWVIAVPMETSTQTAARPIVNWKSVRSKPRRVR